MGVLSNLLLEKFKIKTHSLVNPLVAAVGVDAIPIALNHPDRVGMVIVNLSVNILYISPLPTVAAAAGIRIAPNGGAVSMTWDVDFELVSHDWYGIATGAGSAVFISEIIGEKV